MKTLSSGTLFIVSAPSGTGKTTIVTSLVERFGASHNVRRLITYTSRAQRAGEISGIDYHFIEPADFEQKIAEQFFLEWSLAYGAYYGTPQSLIHDLGAGASYFAIVDRAGARALKEQIPAAVTIWLKPPSLEAIRERLAKRDGTLTDDHFRRLTLAAQELTEEEESAFFDFSFTCHTPEEIVGQLTPLIFEKAAKLT